jgi:His/Glu/Gln/Arg/opine family amino acid ABC transporter permease subunit
MDELIRLFFDLEIMARYLPMIMEGFWMTMTMAVLVVVLGLPLGLILALMRAFQVRLLNLFIVFFVDLFRAIPPLVVIYVFYFAFPYAGVTFGSVTATVLTLTLVMAAFSEEIYWAAMTSLPRGQWEAARSTGLRFGQTLIFVILGQSIRRAIPMLTNQTIAVTKGTALGSTVAVQEILNQALSAQSLSANPSPLTLGALLYLLIFAPMVFASRMIERRFGWGH